MAIATVTISPAAASVLNVLTAQTVAVLNNGTVPVAVGVNSVSYGSNELLQPNETQGWNLNAKDSLWAQTGSANGSLLLHYDFPTEGLTLSPSGDTSGVTDTAWYVAAQALNALNNKPIKSEVGTYWVNSMVDLTRDYIEFAGGGSGRTTIKAAAAMRAVLRLNGNVRGHISDLTIDGNGLAAHEFSMEHTEGTTRHSVDRVRTLGNVAAWVNNTNGDGTITSGSPNFSSASAAFTANDVGKWMLVTGAGTGGVNLFAQIITFTDATHVVLDRNAGTSVTTASFQYGGFAFHNSGCEDVKWNACEVPNSEASPGLLQPCMLLSHPSGLGSLQGCEIWGPIFHNSLTVRLDGGNYGPLVSVNQTGAQPNQLSVDGSWIYDGGTPTSYRCVDSATTYLCSTHIDTSHLVATLASGWINGRLPTGNSIYLGPANVYVQPAGNSNTTMNLLATSSGTSNTSLVVAGGKTSIGGSMTTLQLNSGGSSSHAVALLGKIDGPTTFTNFTSILSSPAVPASGTAQVNSFGVACMVYIQGGTVTAISVDGVATGFTATPCTVLVRPMSTVTLTYSVAPTWVWQAI